MKRCSRCGTTKPLDEFVRSRQRRDGRSSWCRPCHNEAGKSPNARYVNRRAKLRRHFNLAIEVYEAMVESQGGRCAACDQPETAKDKHGRTKALAVDHDHETSVIRGLLCQACNIALGQLDDDPSRLLALAAYAIKARDNTDTAAVPPLIPPRE